MQNILLLEQKYIIYFVQGKGGDELHLIDVRNNLSLLDNYKYNDHINETSWSKEGDYFYIAAGKSDGKIGIVKLNNYKMEIVDEIYGHTSSCYCIQVSKNNKYIGVGSADSLVSIWNTKEMICEYGMSGFEGSVRTIDFGYYNKNDYLAAAGDNHISIIDCNHGVTVGDIKLSKEDATIYAISYHPDGNLLAYVEITKDRDKKNISTIQIMSIGYN